MSVIQLIVVLVVIGVVLWLINTYVPMNSSIKTILNIVVVLIACIYVLSAFGILDSITKLRI